MTAAMAFPGRDGRLRVVGVDLLLTDVSTFTTRLRVGEHGAVMVLTDGSRVIGLPRDPRYLDAAGQRHALLKRPEELEMRVPADAARVLASRPAGERGPVRLESGGAPWWAETSPVPLGPQRRLAITVMVPESDLLGNLGHLRLGIVVVMLAGLALAMVRAVSLARRYSRPIEALVRESERISRGDLDPGAPVASSIREVHRLADAHGRMRLSLKTLLKLEGDLQVARRIQQDTLPERIPIVAGFDIDGWSEPADETGGDTFDVIGYRRVPGERGPRLATAEAEGAEAERAVLLLADATGHGIGPALSVTQVRAMLRMAIRTGEDFPAIIRHLNAQLCADLTEGRFVSAWLGLLDADEQTLTGFSCGQGPLLYYRAAAGSLHDSRDGHGPVRVCRGPRGRAAGADSDGAGRHLRGPVGWGGRRRAYQRRAIRHRTGDRGRHPPLRKLGRGADGGAPGGGGRLHGGGAGRGRPHRRRGQAALSRVADRPAARYGIYARSLQARKETRSCPHPPHRTPSSVRSSTP